MSDPVIPSYLDLLDSQREAAFAALNGLSESQIWQRPAPKKWSIGEIINHNYLLIANFLPLVRWTWQSFGWYAAASLTPLKLMLVCHVRQFSGCKKMRFMR